MNPFANKRVLVTGASGFIGQYVVKSLLAMGAEVHGTSRTVRQDDTKSVTWHQGSFEDIAVARSIMAEVKPHAVFHLAGIVTAASDVAFALPTYHSLLTSTLNLLTIATEMKCEKVVLVGSCTEPDDEDPTPSSPYAAAKWATLGYGKMFQKVYGLPVVMVRPFMGYGPGQDEKKVIPHVVTTLLRGENPELSSCSWVTDYVYIEDMVEGIMLAATAANAEGKVFDLGSGVRISVREVIEKIAGYVGGEGKPLFGVLPDRVHDHARIADTEYTFSEIGWRATTSLDEGLKKMIAYVREKEGK